MKRSFADRGETGFTTDLWRGTDKRRGIGAAPGLEKAEGRREDAFEKRLFGKMIKTLDRA